MISDLREETHENDLEHPSALTGQLRNSVTPRIGSAESRSQCDSVTEPDHSKFKNTVVSMSNIRHVQNVLTRENDLFKGIIENQ